MKTIVGISAARRQLNSALPLDTVLDLSSLDHTDGLSDERQIAMDYASGISLPAGQATQSVSYAPPVRFKYVRAAQGIRMLVPPGQ